MRRLGRVNCQLSREGGAGSGGAVGDGADCSCRGFGFERGVRRGSFADRSGGRGVG